MLRSVERTDGSQTRWGVSLGTTDQKVSFCDGVLPSGLTFAVDAMYQFAKAKDAWYSTWPQDITRRSMAMYVLSCGTSFPLILMIIS